MRDRSSAPPRRRISRDPVELVTAAGFAVWFGLTAISQHPNRSFDRVRDHDPTGLLIGNWRFFAPEPAQHDFHVLHRTLEADGTETPWRESSTIAARHWKQSVWFPTRREEKAIFDLCTELLGMLPQVGTDITGLPSFLALRSFVEHKVRAEADHAAPPQGFQFVIARYTGHDHAHDPEFLLVSPFVALDAAGRVVEPVS